MITFKQPPIGSCDLSVYSNFFYIISDTNELNG